MPHSITLITTISAALGVAFAMGFLATKLRLPALVGYLVAGIIIGPATPGFVANIELSKELAEIGVILLMFGVGLHFSIEELLAVKKIALPGAIAQITVATLLSMGVAAIWGWDMGASLVFGLALSVASTVVLLRALEDRNILETVNGKIAVGWLVVEDLAMVLVLVLLPVFATSVSGDTSKEEQNIALTLLFTIGKVSIFVALMLVVGRRFFPWLLWHTAKTGSRELFTLCVLAAAMGIAFGSAYLFGVSFALGAFFAGTVMRESTLSQRAASESLPLRDAFSVLFFVSVGMLFEPSILIDKPLHVAAVVAIIILGKSIAAFLIVLFFKYPLNTALVVSASLAQIGEFSFILAGMGVSLGVLSIEGQNYILAGALISIALNPLVFKAVQPLREWFCKQSAFACELEKPNDSLAQMPAMDSDTPLPQIILVGYGRVGRHIGNALIKKEISFAVIEQTREKVEKLRKQNIIAICTDAVNLEVISGGLIENAEAIVLAIPDAFRAGQIIDAVKKVNPNIKVVVRTHSEEAADVFAKQGISDVFIGEHELGVSMIRRVTELVSKKHWKET